MSKIRVALVENHELTRVGIRVALQQRAFTRNSPPFPLPRILAVTSGWMSRTVSPPI